MSPVIALSDPAALRLRLLEMLLPHAGSYAVEMAREAEAWVLGAAAGGAGNSTCGGSAAEPLPAAPEVTIRVEIPIEEPRHVQDAPPPSPAGAGVAGDQGGQPPDGDDLQPGAEPGDDRDGGAGEPGHPAPAEGAGAEGAGAEDEDAGELTAPGKDFLWTPERREVLRAGKVAWTEARKEQLRALCAEGLETREIEERMGLPTGRNLVHSSAGRFGFTPMWRVARDARRAAASAAGPVEPAIAVEPVADAPALTVVLPPPAVSVRADIDDQVAAALAADKPDPGAFPVQPKSLAEVEAAEPAPASEAKKTDDPATPVARRPGQPPTGRNWLSNKPREAPEAKAAERALIEQALDRGMAKVTRMVGPGEHPGGAVDIDVVIAFLRWADDSVVPIGKGLWLVNGAESLNAKGLVEKANKRRKRKRQDLFTLSAD